MRSTNPSPARISPRVKPAARCSPPSPTRGEGNGAGCTPGDGNGSYVKPKQPGDVKDPYLRYDESPGHRPHWDYRAPDGKEYRWYPDGTMEPKAKPKPLIMFRLDA